jgi:Family of unknown function (DUF6866) C-terminal domain/Family of unknown function (DUF6866) N-terminal domain
MDDMNLGAVVDAVQQNCNISDAQYAGNLTLCVYLLKMRELFRWENRLPFSWELPKEAVGPWMIEREQLWNGIETSPFTSLPLGDATLDPFDSAAANESLVPLGYVYSGGYGRHCKPHFFVGELIRREERDGFTIYISSCEYARDLEAPPGMQLDKTIFVRQEALRRWLWERYEEWTFSPKNETLGRALACYPFETDPDRALDRMTERETETVLLHELGEARVGRLLGPEWEAMLADFMSTRTEIYLRAVRDLYADCLSTLPELLDADNAPSLHFYFANFQGMRRHLFPELVVAYQKWVQSKNTAELVSTAHRGLKLWSGISTNLIALHKDQGERAGPQIEALLEQRAAGN